MKPDGNIVNKSVKKKCHYFYFCWLLKIFHWSCLLLSLLARVFCSLYPTRNIFKQCSKVISRLFKRRDSWLMFVDLPPSSFPRWWIINAFKIGLLVKVVPFDLSKNREQKHLSYKMSKDDVAISGGKTCASKTKSYARNITRKFLPPCAQILVELGSKKCARCFEDNPRLSRLGYKFFARYCGVKT